MSLKSDLYICFFFFSLFNTCILPRGRGRQTEETKFCMQHRVLEYYQACSNDDPGLTLIYFTARSKDYGPMMTERGVLVYYHQITLWAFGSCELYISYE